jgi:hypothetical protein
MAYESTRVADDTADVSRPTARPPVEIGFVLAGRFDDVDQAAIRKCRESIVDELRHLWPSVAWRVAVVHREVLVHSARVEPIALMDEAVMEATASGWDFTFVITSAELVGHYRPLSRAAVARSLAAAAISTIRLDPAHSDTRAPEAERIDVILRRLRVLILHCLGHLVGLSHSSVESNVMNLANYPEDFDRAPGFTPEQVDQMTALLREVADPRLEEQSRPHRLKTARFYLQSAWINCREIVGAVIEAQPWLFPFRLGRLTTAAGSALAILLLTAEVWDLATGLGAWRLVVMALAAIAASTVWVVARQRLLSSPDRQQLTELFVIRRISTVAIMVLGIVTTYVLLFGIALLAAVLLFRAPLVSAWSTSLNGPPAWGHYIALVVFVSSIGLMIGAFGASFEDQHYFRHVTHVDEEL